VETQWVLWLATESAVGVIERVHGKWAGNRPPIFGWGEKVSHPTAVCVSHLGGGALQIGVRAYCAGDQHAHV